MKVILRPFCFLACLFVLIVSACQHPTQEERHELYLVGQNISAPVLMALEQYHVDNGKYPRDLSLLVPEYLSEIPTPFNNSEYFYRVNESSGEYSLKFEVDNNSGCGYSPRLGWECSFGD